MTLNGEDEMVMTEQEAKASREKQAYDTLKGVIYSLNTGEYVRSQLEHMLNDLYESWYRLAVGHA